MYIILTNGTLFTPTEFATKESALEFVRLYVPMEQDVEIEFVGEVDDRPLAPVISLSKYREVRRGTANRKAK